MSKVYYCIKNFYLFKKGANYYCFAVVGDKYYFSVPNDIFQVTEIILNKKAVDENFEVNPNFL